MRIYYNWVIRITFTQIIMVEFHSHDIWTVVHIVPLNLLDSKSMDVFLYGYSITIRRLFFTGTGGGSSILQLSEEGVWGMSSSKIARGGRGGGTSSWIVWISGTWLLTSIGSKPRNWMQCAQVLSLNVLLSILCGLLYKFYYSCQNAILVSPVT